MAAARPPYPSLRVMRPTSNAAPATIPDSVSPSPLLAPVESEQDTAMTLTQSDVNRLSSLTGKNLLTVEDLISSVTFLSCVSVEGIQIALEPGLLSRLKSRCYKTEFPVFLRQVMIKQLHDFCGW